MGFLLVLSLLLSAAESPKVSEDEKLLAGAKIPTDGAGLLDFFRNRTPSATSTARTKALIRQLGDYSFKVRQQATDGLVAQGVLALPLLREAAKDSDLEVKRRARECIRRIEATATPVYELCAAARVLAVRKPPGAAETLLAFLIGVEDDETAEGVQAALAGVAVRNGKPEQVLVDALADKSPHRRAAAGAALAYAGVKEQQTAVRKLLADADAEVRLRVGLVLVEREDKEAIPVLIALLADLPREKSWPVEELLYRLAGDGAPEVTTGGDENARRKCRDGWAAWWKKHGDKVEIKKDDLPLKQLGFTLFVLLDRGVVLEVGRDGKTRWEIGGLQSPLDAQVLPGNRVLIAEYTTKSVTERNLKGEVLWEKKLPFNPSSAQRQRNGNTFIVMSQQLLEIDRQGKEVFSYAPKNLNVASARRLPDGRVALISNGQFMLIDRAGKKVGGFAVSNNIYTTNSLDVLPNGHILATAYGDGKLLEYDRAGKIVWQAPVSRPIASTRLRNGNTLTSSQDGVVIELDRAGKKVWEHKLAGHPTLTRRR
jgi:hypothetical protein